MAAGSIHLKRDWFDRYEKESCSDSMHPLVIPVLSAQQAARLGPRCGSHVTQSWEAGDKRPMIGPLHGLFCSGTSACCGRCDLNFDSLCHAQCLTSQIQLSRTDLYLPGATVCKQLEDERRHVAISLGQMNKGCSAGVRVRVETRDRKLVFLKYSFTAL